MEKVNVDRDKDFEVLLGLPLDLVELVQSMHPAALIMEGRDRQQDRLPTSLPTNVVTLVTRSHTHCHPPGKAELRFGRRLEGR
jgi:hypothetical protein